MNQTPDWDGLVAAATDVRAHAYAPYSRYVVGAAVLDATGRTFLGVNAENASYGATVCAERAAIVAMVTAGGRKWHALVVVTPDGAAPCGLCRQVLVEFAEADARVLCVAVDETRRTQYDFSTLVPDWFQSDAVTPENVPL